MVEIDGIDRSACGGTHVRTTGEIGPLMIRRVEKIRKHSRVEFLCGWRALAGARRDFEVITNTASSLSCGIDDLAGNVLAQAERLRTAESEQRRLLEQLAESRAAALHARVVPDASGLRRLEETASSIEELRFLAQAFSRLPGVVFVGRLGNPPTVVFATSDDSGINADAQLKALLAIHGGRGGGAPRVAQGTLSEPGAMEALVRDLLSTSS